MSKLDELIQELCPNGVEYKTLAELLKITTGKLNANAMVENGQYAFFTCAETPYYIDTFAFDCEAILISGNGSKVGHINHYIGKFNAYQRTYVLFDFNQKLNVKFLYYYLKTTLKPYILDKQKDGSVPYITLPMLEQFVIPFPAKEIQNEIVQILDNFTKLETQLKKELNARKKQYEYYRDKLLNFDKNINHKTIKEICNSLTKKTLKKSQLMQGEKYPVINSGREFYGYYNKYNNETPAFCLASRGEYAGFITYIDVPFWAGGLCYPYASKTQEISTKFIYYYLKSKEQHIMDVVVDRGSIPALNKTNIEKYKIPTPPIETQNKIVQILDNFKNLITKLENEIEARQKQYEYYRDKLLTFKEKTA
ncbi:MAG: restriction endonuclease subunit S [Candidatus Gastranaerophilales bacterium]|nr:restriction endonuclease subunit S [Candidatus Gastranaerophilales bacterium]